MVGSLYLASICPFSRLQASEVTEGTLPAMMPLVPVDTGVPKGNRLPCHGLTTQPHPSQWPSLFPQYYWQHQPMLTQIAPAKKPCSQVCPGTRRNYHLIRPSSLKSMGEHPPAPNSAGGQGGEAERTCLAPSQPLPEEGGRGKSPPTHLRKPFIAAHSNPRLPRRRKRLLPSPVASWSVVFPLLHFFILME